MIDIELAIIQGRDKNDADDIQYTQGSLNLVDLVQECKYEEVLSGEVCKSILRQVENTSSIEDLNSHIVQAVEKYCNDEDLSRQMNVLCVGISSLQLFAQSNWTGPKPSSTSPLETWLQGNKQLEDEIRSNLTVDGEPLYKLCQQISSLFLARVILLSCRHCLQQCQIADWWLMRYLQVHQALLEERSPTFKTIVLDIIDKVGKIERLNADDKFRNAAIQFHLEAGHLLYFYYEPKKSEEHFRTATKLSQLSVELTGAMGKRTRWQQEDKAQLVLQVERLEEATHSNLPSTKNSDLPKDVYLEDDTVLNEIKFADSTQNFLSDLSPIEQAVVLAYCHQHRRNHEGQGKIIQEESMAFITTVLQQPCNASIQMKALFLRTQWESDSFRRAERSLSQLEELANFQSRPLEGESMSRLDLLYSVWPPDNWTTQQELGNFLVKIGANSSALEVFLRIEAWEDIIKCYAALGRREKAESVIREQLDNKETPEMWCYLGDVLDDEQHYIKAWELSNCRCARAQRALAYHYLRKKEFEKCLPCFEKSLKINALQIGVWFSLGCTAMACEQFETAIKAFQRCVTLNADNFEAWNNLSSAFIKTNQKSRAFMSLQEAIKCEYENWRLWENFIIVATDCGEFEEVISAYHRMMDIRGKHADAQVLGIVTRAVNEDIKDGKGQPAGRLRHTLQELFGRVTAKVTSDADIWHHYATLLTGAADVSETDRQRALQYLQKSYRCLTQKIGWEKDVNFCETVASQAIKISDVYRRCSEESTDTTKAVQMLSADRLMLKGLVTKIEQQHKDSISQQVPEELKDSFNKLETELQTVLDLLEQKKGS